MREGNAPPLPVYQSYYTKVLSFGCAGVFTIPASAEGEITVDSTNIYANGYAIIISDKDNDTATTTDTLIYLDANSNGVIDSGETAVSLTGPTGNTTNGYDLSGYTIYGGRYDNAGVTGDTRVTMLSGTVKSIFGNSDGNGTVSGSTNVTVSGSASVTGTVYGGGRGGTVGASETPGSTNVTISDSALVTGYVYGGGNDKICGSTNITITGGTITSYVYGGGNNVTVDTNITISGGTIRCVCGGGSSSSDKVGGSTSVTISGGTVTGSVFGGSGTVSGNTSVTISGGTVGSSDSYVYGGGIFATVSGSTNVTVSSGTVTGTVYGGSDGQMFSVTVGGNTNVTVSGGTVGNVYGSGDRSGATVTGSATVKIGADAAVTSAAICYSDATVGTGSSPQKTGFRDGRLFSTSRFPQMVSSLTPFKSFSA